MQSFSPTYPQFIVDMFNYLPFIRFHDVFLGGGGIPQIFGSQDQRTKHFLDSVRSKVLWNWGIKRFKINEKGGQLDLKEKIDANMSKSLQSVKNTFWWKIWTTLGPSISGTKCDRDKVSHDATSVTSKKVGDSFKKWIMYIAEENLNFSKLMKRVLAGWRQFDLLDNWGTPSWNVIFADHVILIQDQGHKSLCWKIETHLLFLNSLM